MFGCRCPEKKIATTFVHDNKGYAEAEIPMYRFAEYNVVNIQCDILICKGVFAVFMLLLFCGGDNEDRVGGRRSYIKQSVAICFSLSGRAMSNE